MKAPKFLDWRFVVAIIVMLVVGSFCYNSVSANMRADNLIAIAERAAAQSAQNADEVRKLRAQLDWQNKKARAQVVRIQQQNRVQRRQIDLLVRYLRVNGLEVPRIAPPTTGGTSPRTSAGTTSPTPAPDYPGRSDTRRNPRTLDKPAARRNR